ncbi:MAG: secondary thiamine-phosphate synthase enzyme YjbQ [bacterium]
METITVRSKERMEMVDITPQVAEVLARAALGKGACLVYVPHTTAAVTVNEGADPDVCRDILESLSRLVPRKGGYHHGEGNSDSHILTSLVGSSQLIPVEAGKLVLGTWQKIFLCEFDGPRTRNVWVQLLGVS